MSDDILIRLKNAEHVGAQGKTQLNIAQLLLNREASKEIQCLRDERDHYKRIAEEAVSNLEQAIKLLQAFQAAVHD